MEARRGRSLGPELQLVVTHLLWVLGTEVLCKSSRHSELLRLFSSPTFLLLTVFCPLKDSLVMHAKLTIHNPTLIKNKYHKNITIFDTLFQHLLKVMIFRYNLVKTYLT